MPTPVSQFSIQTQHPTVLCIASKRLFTKYFFQKYIVRHVHTSVGLDTWKDLTIDSETFPTFKYTVGANRQH